MKFVRSRFRQLARYSAVSLISTITGIVILGVLVGTKSMPAGWANVVATAIGTIPSFELNRRWVWERHGDRHLGREVIPFAALSFAGLGLSTVAVHFVDIYVRHAGWTNGTRTLAVEVASNAAFGALWMLQFLILDRVLFRKHAVDAASSVGAPVDDALIAA